MVLASSQISKRSVLVFRAAMDILDHVASSVDIYRAAMDNVRRLNKFSRTDQNCKFARIQVAAHMSKIARMFARKDPANMFSHMDHASMFSRNHL